VLFPVTIVVLSWVERDFLRGVGWKVTDSGDVPWPSALALGPYGWVQVANFALTGALLFVFARALRPELGHRRTGRVAGALLMGVAVGVMLCAARTDRHFGASPTTWNGWVHAVGFIVLLLTSFLAAPATALALRGNARWRRFPALSAAAGVAMPVLLIGLAAPLADFSFYGYLLVVFGWLELLGIRLWQLER